MVSWPWPCPVAPVAIDRNLTGGAFVRTFRALERTYPGPFHVTTDTDTEIAPAFAQLLLLFAQLFVAYRFQRQSQSLRIVAAVVANG